MKRTDEVEGGGAGVTRGYFSSSSSSSLSSLPLLLFLPRSSFQSLRTMDADSSPPTIFKRNLLAQVSDYLVLTS